MPDKTWIDVDLNLNTKSNGDIQEFTYIDTIYESLKNIFETRKGDRRMLPKFAQNLDNILFDQIDEDTSEILGELLFEAIEFWEPRIEVKNINVNPKYDQNKYEVKLTFIIINTEEINTFNYILKAY